MATQPDYTQRPREAPGGQPSQTPLWLSVLWYIFIGWWLAFFWDALAWLLAAIVITMPTAVSMLDATPYVMTLHRQPEMYLVNSQVVIASVRNPTLAQRPVALRFLYWFFIGWWFSAFWIMVLGYLATLFIVTIPTAFRVFNMTPLITTLERY